MSVQANQPPGPLIPRFVEFGLPFTVEFDISAKNLDGANSARFRIYNLNPATRNLLLKNNIDFNTYIPISFYAGYGDDDNNWPLIFFGNVSQGWSFREGTNFITQLECYDGGYAFSSARISVNGSAGERRQSILNKVIKQLEPFGVKPGAISFAKVAGAIPRGNSFSGNMQKVLNDLLGANSFFIYNNKINILAQNEYIPNQTLSVISSDTGLLGTPLRESTYLTFDIMFEPRLVLGQLVTIRSSTAPANFNQSFVVTGIHHKGTISGSTCGEAITTVEVQFGNGDPTPVGQDII